MSELEKLFQHEMDVALFYFSRHGHINDIGGYLVTQDARKNDPGVKLNDILLLANHSPVREVSIILDSCHSGEGGNARVQNIIIKKGFSLLASSRSDQNQLQFKREVFLLQ